MTETYYRQADRKSAKGHILAFQNDEEAVVGEEKVVFCTECGSIYVGKVIAIKPDGTVSLGLDIPKNECPGKQDDFVKYEDRELVNV